MASRLPPALRRRRSTARPKLTFDELRRQLDVAFAARDGKALLRGYRALTAMRRDGRVGRRRACPVCHGLSQPVLGGEVVHQAGCALQAALKEVEAFIATGGRTRSIDEARAGLKALKAKP